MATNLAKNNVQYDTMAHFDRVATQIEQTFNQLIEQLIGRKKALLRKVLQLREDFHSKEFERREAIQELEKTQEQLRQMSVRANLNTPIHQQASQAYEQGLKHLSTPTKLSSLSYSCPTRDRLVELIDSFGELSEGINYLDKKEPILTAGVKGNGVGEFHVAIGIALDEANQIIFIVDMGNSRIQLFSFQGEFIKKFGEDELPKPWGIAVTEEHIFVTDVSLHSLLRYGKKTLQLIDRVGGKGSQKGKLNEPHGLAVDSNGDVFIADSYNNRVSIFSKNVKFLSCIGQGKLWLPQDIKLTTESVVVLDWSEKCVHFFTRRGDLLSSSVSQGMKEGCLVYHPGFFCLDKTSNILINDRLHLNMKIVSRSGELIHTLGGEGYGRGEHEPPCGIAISEAGTLYVVSQNPKYTLQAF